MTAPKLTAREVKDALRQRHPASGGVGAMVGEWTTAEELFGIDLFAWSAWGSASRVGYEVKISRGDYRRELLRPGKRAHAVEVCDEFYFAVPDGLLTREELAWREPGDLRLDAWQRTPCPGWDVGPVEEDGQESLFGGRRPARGRRRWGGACRKMHRASWYGGIPAERRAILGKHAVRVPVPVTGQDRYDSSAGEAWVLCPTCQGKGYTAKSRIEQEAPTLWVPPDVGLITVKAGGGGLRARVARKAPSRTAPPRALTAKEMAYAFRWVSVRPDPRHVADRRHEAALNAVRGDSGDL